MKSSSLRSLVFSSVSGTKERISFRSAVKKAGSDCFKPRCKATEEDEEESASIGSAEVTSVDDAVFEIF